MKQRSEDSTIDLTDEWLANPPPIKDGDPSTKVWYDRTIKSFAVVRYIPRPWMKEDPRQPTYRMVMVIGPRAARAAVMDGVRIRSDRFIYLKGPTVAEARQEVIGILPKIAEWKQIGKTLPKVRPGILSAQRHSIIIDSPPVHYRAAVSPQDLLKDGPAVENPNYDALMSVLMDAFSQATEGKGAERHAAGMNFEDQDMMKIMNEYGPDFAFGQALKKIREGRRLGTKRLRHELIGAIVYLAGAVVWIDKEATKEAGVGE